MKTQNKMLIICSIIIISCIYSMIQVSNDQQIEPTDEYIFVEQTSRIPVATPTPEATIILIPIELLLNDIIINDPANKDFYSLDGGSIDVHVCGKMACEQCEYIKTNYEYKTGITLLWHKYGGISHAQTWVIIDDNRYILESTYDYYWIEKDHYNKFNNEYKIKFVTLSKGKEMVKESDEYTRKGKIY